MGRRGCASAMGMIKFPSSCSSPKALCNQFIDYYICSRGVFCINHIKLRNFVVITIECSIATVDRGSIMTRIYRWSMMVYSSLQYYIGLEQQEDESVITPMALVHPLHPIRSKLRNNRWHLWIGWCASSWRAWFWSVNSIYYHIHTIHYSCILSNWNTFFLRDIYIARGGVAMAVCWMIWYCIISCPVWFQLYISIV